MSGSEIAIKSIGKVSNEGGGGGGPKSTHNLHNNYNNNFMSPSLRIPVENETPLNAGGPLGGQEVSGVIRMCEEGIDRQSDSLNNTELKNFFEDADDDENGDEIVEDANIVQ